MQPYLLLNINVHLNTFLVPISNIQPNTVVNGATVSYTFNK